jgi:sec-independent protein translocase protein TatB
VIGLTFDKLLIILVIAGLLIGPQRLPVVAMSLGRFARHVRKLTAVARERVRDELGEDFDTVDWKKLDPRQYDPRRIIRDALLEEPERKDRPIGPQ